MNPSSRNDRRRPQEPQEEKQFDERIIHINRVARVVKGGRRNIALPHLAAGHAAPHGPPRLIASLTALRSIILRT